MLAGQYRMDGRPVRRRASDFHPLYPGLLNAALEGKLDHAGFVTEPVFGLEIPRECPGIPTGILMPRESWKNKETYDQKAGELAKSFQDQFKQYETLVADEIKNAGPVG